MRMEENCHGRTNKSYKILCENIRRTLLVHKLFKLVYYVDEKKSVLYIVSLWDVRRDPSTLISRIRKKKT